MQKCVTRYPSHLRIWTISKIDSLGDQASDKHYVTLQLLRRTEYFR